MQNIESRVEGKKLILVIDLEAPTTVSGSGKSLIIASTQGNASIAGVKVGLNVYKSR